MYAPPISPIYWRGTVSRAIRPEEAQQRTDIRSLDKHASRAEIQRAMHALEADLVDSGGDSP